MSEINVIHTGSAFLLGYLIGNAGFSSFCFTSYLTYIWLTRTTLSFCFSALMVEDFMIKVAKLSKDEFSIISDPRITFEYNWYHNKITVRKNVLAKIFTDADKLDFVLRKIFNSLLCWDIFYQYKPLEIVHAL